MLIDTSNLPEARRKAEERLQRALKNLDAARCDYAEAQQFLRQVLAAESLALGPAVPKESVPT